MCVRVCVCACVIPTSEGRLCSPMGYRPPATVVAMSGISTMCLRVQPVPCIEEKTETDSYQE